MGFLLQLRLLLWKNFTLRIRQPARLVIEIFWPLVLFIILVSVRQRPGIREDRPECHYHHRAMPSAGTMAFMASYLCNVNNPCQQSMNNPDTPGFITDFNASAITGFADIAETILGSNQDREEFVRLTEDLEILDQLVRDLTAIVGNLTANATSRLTPIGIRLGDVLTNRTDFLDLVANQSISLTPGALENLLNATFDFARIVEVFNDTDTTDLDDLIRVATELLEMDLTDTTTGFIDTTMVSDLLNITCNDEILFRYFDFADEQAARDVQTQFCNLTLTEVTEFFTDLFNDLNVTGVIDEVTDIYEELAGEVPPTNLSYIISRVGYYANLTGQGGILTDVPSLTAFAESLSAFPVQANESLTLNLGNLVCGGTSAIFNMDTDSQDNLEQEFNRQDDRSGLLDIDTTSRSGDSPVECSDLFAAFQESQATRIIWRQIQPIVEGVINYTPDTPATRKLIKEASRTFETIQSVLNFVVDLDQFLPRLEELVGDLDAVRDFVSSPACRNTIYTARTLLGVVPAPDLGPLSTLIPGLSGLDDIRDIRNLLQEDICDTVAEFIGREGSNDTFDWRDALENVRIVLNNIEPYARCINLNKFVGYPDMYSMTSASLAHIENNTFWAGIVFDSIEDENSSELPTIVKYTIRMDTDRVDSTRSISDRYWRPGPRGSLIDLRYWTFGFIYIQDMIDHAIIRLQTNVTQEPGVYTKQFPYPCWVSDRFVMAISRSLPLFMIISWIYSVAMIVKGIVYEKEMRLKEVMKIMGLGNGVHWLAWFINSFAVMLVTIILFVIILRGGLILEYSDPSVVFVYMLGFTCSTIAQCFLISVFFSRANLAAVCGGFIYFVLYLPYTQLVQWEDELDTPMKILFCLSSNIAMGYGCNYLALFEEQAVGAQWHNLNESPMVDDTYNLGGCIAMMFLDAIIYMLLTWYIEAVFPGQFGIPRKWYFPIQKSYWCGHGNTKSFSGTDMEIDDFKDHSGNFEPDPTDRPVGVAVRNLRKVYRNGDKVAVDGLTVNFYEGQITSFLGHNGAGKTTTMSILTGLFPPTSGTAYVYGKDIHTDIDEIRTKMGMCPQHNVLFDLLTVEEHIWFYSRLKGRPANEVKKEIDEMINDVGLPHKRKVVSQNLSGGMKRKLSVAVAFVGGSRTVILDEPTAGVDPYARRAIWELLLKFRKGRTIILSTHHMDEADVLGDRIAIISQGKLCTVGSSLFLKNRYGSGYYLTLVREDGSGDNESVSDSMSISSRPSTATSVRTVVDVKPAVADTEDEGYEEKIPIDENGSDDAPTPLPPPKLSVNRIMPGFHIGRLTAFIQNFVPGAQMVEDTSMEVTFRLPEDDEHASKFQKLFAALELSHKDMGISSYGISDTSLEEVFLRVAEENSTPEDGDEMRRNQLEESSDYGKYPRPISRLSHRKKHKTSLFNLKYKNRVDSKENLTTDMDDNGHQSVLLESVASEPEDTAPTDINFSGAGEVAITGRQIILRQIVALFIKRFHHVRRSKKGFVSEIILPAAFVCLALVFSLIIPPFRSNPPLELQPWMYEPKTGDRFLYTFFSNDNPSNPVAANIESNLVRMPYYGTRCMNPSVYQIDGKECLASEGPRTAAPVLEDSYPECSCDSGFQRCPSGAGGPPPAMRVIRTNDRLYNATGRNISDWLVKTMEDYQKRRYGGYSLGEENPLGRLSADQIETAVSNIIEAAGANDSVLNGTQDLWRNLENVLKFGWTADNVIVWFNNKGWAAGVSYMSAMNNLILRSILPSDKDPDDYGIVTVNHPINLTKEQLNEETLYNSAVDVVVAICVIFAMSFVPASFVLFLIEERVSNSKHLQFVSGINPTVYWLCNWAWDMINYAIPAILCILIFLAFGQDAYTSSQNFPCLLALLFLYGWAIVPMMYPFSRLFDIPSSAFVALSCVNVFLGTVSTLATFILELLERDDPDLADVNSILKKVFLLLPHYCLGRGLIDMASLHVTSDLMSRLEGETTSYDLFEFNLVGRNLFSMFMLGIAFNILNLLIEYKFFLSWLWLTAAPVQKSKREDVDVAREKERVLSGGARNDVLRLEGLTKVYSKLFRRGKLTAVDHLFVGIPKGQCFGLLGVNGAGKTTTFKMLTGDEAVTEGDAFINNYSIGTDMVTVRQFMGYCPQFDALAPLLTGREHLEFYARIRGISPSKVKSVADWAIRKLGLIVHADKISSSYSGGNKRKLSTAIALIGNPPIIFLDEPTTGMDPGARRFLWNCINSIVKSGRSVILTSHSMEECEALCGRLAIMVNGTFQCLGSIQHLKNRFGNGYTIILRVSGQNPQMEPIMNFITNTFPSAKLREKHHNMLQYQLGTTNLSLSRLFEAMEEAKQSFNVEDYSVSQTTLDQVFINFAKRQMDVMDHEIDDNFNHEDDLDDFGVPVDPENHYYAESASTGFVSEYDDDSLAGSTIGLMRPGSGRSSSSQRGANGAVDLKKNGDLPNGEDGNTAVSVRL